MDANHLRRFAVEARGETLSPCTVANITSATLAEERDAPQAKVSQTAAPWSAEFRTRQAKPRADADEPGYTKLSEGDRS